MLSADALTALREIVEYNDVTSSANARVSRVDVCKMLSTHFGWTGGPKEALDTVCREQLGRESFRTKGAVK